MQTTAPGRGTGASPGRMELPGTVEALPPRGAVSPGAGDAGQLLAPVEMAQMPMSPVLIVVGRVMLATVLELFTGTVCVKI